MSYKNAFVASTTSNQTLYTAPSGTTAIVQAMHIANTLAVSLTVTVEWIDASAGNAVVTLLQQVSIPPNAALQGIEKPLVLEPGDSIRVRSSVNGAHITLSLWEETA